ncbi:MAG: nitric-oxide reductase, partial [Gaiellales bacterium]
FGTFGMLGIAAAYYVIPILRKTPNFDQRLGKLGFWLVFIGVLGMGFAFAIGGTIQVYVYRILGLDWFGGDVTRAMATYKAMLPLFGLVMTTGAGVLAYDLFTMGQRVTVQTGAEAGNATLAVATGWSRPLTGFEAGIWLMLMWVFGTLITLGLLSFNLARVRVEGDPTLPYLLAGVGYPGLLLVTLLFVWRFLASLEARAVVGEESPMAGALPALA